MSALLLYTAACSYSVGSLRPAARVAHRAPVVTAQVNSDSRVTAEYFDFLLGRNKKNITEDGPSIIVGQGKIGSMLLDFGSRNGYEDVAS